MSRRNDLKTIDVAPLAFARSAAASAIRRVRDVVGVVQSVRSAVKSVDFQADPVHVEYTPKAINASAVRIVSVGMQDVGILGGLQMSNDHHTVTFALKFDAYLLDRHLPAPAGSLVAAASCRVNSRVRVVLRETIDALPVPPAKPAPRRLSRPGDGA